MNPPAPDPPDSTPEAVSDSLMRHFDALRLSTTTQQRLDLLAELTAYWYGPPAPTDGLTEAELQEHSLPLPLRWWFARYGRRRDILQCPNSIPPLDALEADDDGRMVFYIEEQAVYLWATTSEGDDPPVWIRENEDDTDWEPEAETLSGFLLQAFLLDGIFNAPYGASASWLDMATVERLTDALPPLPMGAWRWPEYPARFYGREGAFMFVSPNGEEDGGDPAYSVWIGAKTQPPLLFLKTLLAETVEAGLWDYVTL